MAKKVTLDELAKRAGIDTIDTLWLERKVEEDAIAFEQLRVGEEVVASIIKKNCKNQKSIQPFYYYMEILRDEGNLDIGKGDNYEYGFKMPHPQDDERRELVLYRRR